MKRNTGCKWGRFISLFIVLCLVFVELPMQSLIGSNLAYADTATKSSFVFVDKNGNSIKKLSLIKGVRTKIYAKDKDGNLMDVKWISKNKKIVKVNKKGAVRGVNYGKTKIKVINLKTSETTVIKVKVRKKIMPKSLKIIASEKSVFIGDKLDLTTKITPKNSDEQDVEWYSSNSEVAKVNDNGVVEGISRGKCKIHAKIKNSKVKKSITIKVKEVPVSAITNPYGTNGISLLYKQTMKLTYSVQPANATHKNVKFSSANSTIVSVTNDGQVKALRPGHTFITIKAAGTKVTTKIPVKVTVKNGLLTKEMLDKFNLTCIDKLMIVAHPDDESIFGGGHLAQSDYFVLCLTNNYSPARVQDFNTALATFNDKGIILGYPDLEDGKRSDWKAVKDSILKDLELILNYKKWDLVVTHNPAGEYNHIHHQMTSANVTQVYNKLNKSESYPLYYFGKYYKPAEAKIALKDALQLDPKILAKKNQVLAMYRQQSIIKILQHMNPYENWIEAKDWK